MAGDLLYLTIVLQKAARYVQRDVRAIDHAVQQEQVFGDDFFDVIRNEHLVAIQLDFAALQLDLALDLGEIQNALQAERIIHIQVDPEKRIVIIVECLAVKFLVFLFRAVLRVLQIQRLRVVERFVVLAREIEVNVIRHEGAVLFHERTDPSLIEEFLFRVRDVHDDLRAALCPVAFLNGIGALAVRFPMHALGVLAIRFCKDLNVFGNHICRIKSQAEMSDDPFSARLFVLGKKICRAGKCDLRNVFFYLVLGHADAVVLHGKRLGILIYRDLDAELAVKLGSFPHFSKFFVFRNGIRTVCNDLAQENILVRVQPFFDNRHHVFA